MYSKTTTILVTLLKFKGKVNKLLKRNAMDLQPEVLNEIENNISKERLLGAKLKELLTVIDEECPRMSTAFKNL